MRDDDDFAACSECGNPLGPWNMGYLCKACRREAAKHCRHTRRAVLNPNFCKDCETTVPSPATGSGEGR